MVLLFWTTRDDVWVASRSRCSGLEAGGDDAGVRTAHSLQAADCTERQPWKSDVDVGVGPPGDIRGASFMPGAGDV
jgi:hypothetical protein